jgi:hypothetical protein
MSTEPSCAGLNPSAARPAFSSLDLLPTVDSWAVRSGPPVSVALAGPVGFQVSAPKRGSVARSVVAYDFLDPTFYFSFVGPSLVVTYCIALSVIQAFNGAPARVRRRNGRWS